MEYIWKQMIRSPLRCLFLTVFAAVVAVVLCSLSAGKARTQTSYQEIYRNIDVVCTLTNATGDSNEGLWIGEDVISLFTGASGEEDGSLRPYVRQLDLKGSVPFYLDDKPFEKKNLVGLTSLSAEVRLLPENQCTVTWLEGYDETIFSGSERVCLLPQSMWQGGAVTELEIPFSVRGGEKITVVFSVAGTYTGSSQDRVYCSWDAYRGVMEERGTWVYAEFLRMILADNDRLEEFRTAARALFPAPRPDSTAADQLAMDINDDYLMQTSRTLERSMRTNEIASGVVLALSVCVGFLSGFLLIHSRKREIFLQRALGTPLHRIALGFLIEQVSMAVLGVALGGAWFRWSPLDRLALFVLIFAAGLLAALMVFLRNGLMTAMKEDI